MYDIIQGKTVLITGGTGFLGINLVKELIKFQPKSIRVFSRDEVKHHKVDEMFKDYKDDLGDKLVRNFLGDVRDYKRLLKATEGADIVIHAAALKRIDLLEYNVEESIKTNVFGTLNIVRASLQNKVDKVVLVSTDKACFPINTYGACKYIGERVFIESNYSKGRSMTKFFVVRYGNVLESTGSVIPFFTEKIKQGLKIPITDERMTRFVISSDEAVNLIFSSLRYGVGGEIFVPKLPSMNVLDLAEVLKEKFGLQNPFEIVGIRAGEKIHELLINESEILRTYDFGDVYVIAPFLKRTSPWENIIIDGSYKIKKISGDMREYNSKDSVVPKEELKRILEDKLKM